MATHSKGGPATRASSREQGTNTALADRYDCFLLDLDGVLYRGDRAIARAPEAVRALRARGKRVVFITNNSSRTPEEVAHKLGEVGIGSDPSEIVTSALATATTLSRKGVRSAFVIGESGIRTALMAAGIEVRDGDPQDVDCVVVGFDRGADYPRFKRAALLVQRGASLVATNPDASYPAPDGLWPGAGALLAVLTTTLGRPADDVIGKPHAPLYLEALDVGGGRRPLVVGDRLDTDIAGVGPLGWDSLLVLTGVAQPPDLLAARTLPTYVANDLSSMENALSSVRRAAPADAPMIEKLLRDAGLQTDGVKERIAESVVAVLDNDAGRAGETGDGRTGEDGGDADNIVGTAALEVFGPTAHLRSVAVREPFRRMHTGTLVVAAAVKLARERGAHDLFAVTEDATPFFERLGFERIGTKAAVPDAIAATPMIREHCPSSSTAFRLQLA
jgi:HAD superfamily hydrolase (TIGR01457 family)